MNEIVTRAPLPAAPGGAGSLIPRTLPEAIRMAEVMAGAKLVPNHLRGDVGSCFMIVEQAQRWNMSPFLVAQCTSDIGGKLCYEGKLIAAAITSTGGIIGEFNYEFKGDPKKPEGLSVVVSALRASDRQRKEITLAWADAKTKNTFWVTQPEQQLVYAGARVWARRWTPGPMLGVYAPEEMETDGFVGTTVDAATDPLPPAAAEPAPKPESDPKPEVGATTRKPSVAEWLNALERDLAACQTEADWVAINTRDDVKTAQEKATGNAKERLAELLVNALDRVTRVSTTGMET